MRDAAESLMGPVSTELREATKRISRVELGTPSDWGELLWAFGLRMGSGASAGREAVLHGSGIQSVLAYSVLHMLDTSLGSGFGWRRGAVWAVEEPESFLHADLQAQLAEAQPFITCDFSGCPFQAVCCHKSCPDFRSKQKTRRSLPCSKADVRKIRSPQIMGDD